MPAKKMKKMEKSAGCSCDCHGSGYTKIVGWILVILGLLGLLQAIGYINLGPYLFAYIWSLIVLIIGVKKVFWYTCTCGCGCCK